MADTYTVGTDKTYSTIQDAVDAIPGDLSGQGVQTVEVYQGGVAVGDGWEYRENVDALSGFSNEDASNYIHLQAMESNSGKRATGIVILGQNPGAGVTWRIVQLVGYARLTGFCVTADSEHNTYIMGIRAYDSSGWNQISGCVVYGLESSGQRVYGMLLKTGTTTVSNCIFCDFNCTIAHHAIGIYMHNGNQNLYNCTVHNMLKNGAVDGTTGIGIWANTTSGIKTVKNCISTGSATNYSGGANFDTLEYSISEDATAGAGTGCQNNKDPDTDIKYVSSSIGSEDLHIQSGSCAEDAGVALGDVTEDIDGDARSDPPDIGADELAGITVWGPYGNLNYLGGGVR